VVMHMLFGINIVHCAICVLRAVLRTFLHLDESRDGVCLLLIPKDSKVEFDSVRTEFASTCTHLVLTLTHEGIHDVYMYE